MGAVVIVCKEGPEADGILDAFEQHTDTPSEPVANGRRYHLHSVADWDAGVSGISKVLDRLKPGWRDHLAFLEPS